MATHKELVGFVWSVTDLLRGDYKQSGYGWGYVPLADPNNPAINLRTYLDAFSPGAVDVLEKYGLDAEITRLDAANFAYGFDSQYDGLLLDRHEMNSRFFQRLLSDPAFRAVVTDWTRNESYSRIREQGQDAG